MNIKTHKKTAEWYIYIFFILAMSVLTSKILGTALVIESIMLMFLFLSICKRDEFSFNFFLVCTIFQNIILVLSASDITSKETTFIIVIKELNIYICMFFYFIKKELIDLNLRSVCFILFLMLSIIQIFRGGNIKLAVIALRQIIIIFSCFYFGASLKIRNIRRIYINIVVCSVAVGIIGIILYMFSDQKWINVGYALFWSNKTGGNSSVSFTNFYTYDFGFKLKRIVSTFVEPLSCSHFVGAGFVIAFFLIPKRYFLKIFIALVIFMGFTKSSVALFACMIGVLIYTKIKTKNGKTTFWILFTLTVMCGFSYIMMHVNNLSQASSTSNHFSAFIYGVKNASLLGNGLGTAGYNAYMMGLKEYDSAYNESFFALCMAQVGTIGVALIYTFLGSCIINNYKIYMKDKNKYVLISLILSIDIVIESFFSASSISMLGTGLYLVLNGITFNMMKEGNNT